MAHEVHISPEYQGIDAPRWTEREIAALAGRQHGLVARRQLLRLGLGTGAIEHRLAIGRLHRVHRGVYALGHSVLTAHSRWLAVVLACGPKAALCRRSAAALRQLRAYSGRHEVAVPLRRNQPEIRTVRLALAPDEVTVEDGIPVTTVARTLLDLAAVLDLHRLDQVVGRAEQRLLTDSPSLPELIERHRGARGLANLRAVLADRRIGLDVAESELEIEFAAFLADRGLPRPERNVWVWVGDRSFQLDCLWRESGLAVELDSREFHANDASFEGDRARDLALMSVGIRTARVTARRLRVDSAGLERELLAALSASSSARSRGAGSRSCPRRSG